MLDLPHANMVRDVSNEIRAKNKNYLQVQIRYNLLGPFVDNLIQVHAHHVMALNTIFPYQSRMKLGKGQI